MCVRTAILADLGRRFSTRAFEGRTAPNLDRGRSRMRAMMSFDRGTLDRIRVSFVPSQSPIDDLERDQRFREHALQNVEPAWPTIEQAAPDQERVDKDAERRGPSGKPDSIGAA
jgi:hypothetical protein